MIGRQERCFLCRLSDKKVQGVKGTLPMSSSRRLLSLLFVPVHGCPHEITPQNTMLCGIKMGGHQMIASSFSLQRKLAPSILLASIWTGSD